MVEKCFLQNTSYFYDKDYVEDLIMINEEVVHQKFGKGTIIQVRDGTKPYEKYIKIRFNNCEEKEFVFPSVFQSWLSTDSKSLQKRIESALALVTAEKAKTEKAKKIEAAKKELEKAQAQ